MQGGYTCGNRAETLGIERKGAFGNEGGCENDSRGNSEMNAAEDKNQR